MRTEDVAVVAKPGDTVLVVMPEGTDHKAAKELGELVRQSAHPDVKFVFFHHEYRLMVIGREG